MNQLAITRQQESVSVTLLTIAVCLTERMKYCASSFRDCRAGRSYLTAIHPRVKDAPPELTTIVTVTLILFS